MYQIKKGVNFMVYVREVFKADDFNPEEAISDMMAKSSNGMPDEEMIDEIRSHQNPIAPPPNMKLFSERIEEVGDMRHFLYNRLGGPINIINIDSGYLWNDLDEEQTKLYKSDNTRYGTYYPHDPGLFYARNCSDTVDDMHDWVSVPGEITEALHCILYWMKFAELTGIEPDMRNLSGSAKTMYQYINDHKDELMRGYDIIASANLYD